MEAFRELKRESPCHLLIEVDLIINSMYMDDEDHRKHPQPFHTQQLRQHTLLQRWLQYLQQRPNHE
ncbi:Oligopeptide transport ATP-binding protein [Streptococcus parauberis KRS-02083]|uniref:Oligopeptide transport ATP-binding protein n=1 Tax=Streptococcus parauberis KRS-02083 TaxID=1207545 RepID=A0ABN0IPI5_9STRE|nr:Oligopeptide transport ATP-binding protein [Streptococcus parauberis KRS-02083]